MKLNNRGFTLVELLATIVIFAIVAGLGAFSVTAIIKNSKQKNYELLVKNIKDAAEVFYQERTYGENSAINNVGTKVTSGKGGYRLHLYDLVNYGYLTGNSKTESGDYTLVNPLDNVNIGGCYIYIYYSNDDQKYVVKKSSSSTNNDSCPNDEHYSGTF